jgi:hypothetical protein
LRPYFAVTVSKEMRVPHMLSQKLKRLQREYTKARMRASAFQFAKKIRIKLVSFHRDVEQRQAGHNHVQASQ